ncbi:MAG TPA: biotin carboxylase N-terminal domain-containing protein [Blastocatellia bacterium]|nr:biotin carboxylase N-terminal domain-containing protein [Blastocatellia bacterium]
MKTFHKILIAGRGEIALRIIRTCRAMGIAAVAVYSDADACAPHVLAADEAVRLGPAAASESYLNIERIIEAARRTRAEAIHPGYGFLSENADFAEACAAAGLVFIGPSPQAIRRMGLKSAGRQVAAAADVPVVPGYDGEDQSDETLLAQMRRIGFPVLIKASAGGGGKGMRVVQSESEVAEAIAGARREAEKAFGNGALLLEKFIAGARHVEVQILGDAHGHLVHLFERDCSVQRRHQKIIEESPSPAVSAELREQLGAAAVRIGRALDYINAGTVEFILAPTGEFYFIEVNTRLQVEHPVTELITGVDLVRLQIEIAEGKPLQFAQAELKSAGHAIEARLYAEDPARDFLPATGTIHEWLPPVSIHCLAGAQAACLPDFDQGLHPASHAGRLPALQRDNQLTPRLPPTGIDGVRIDAGVDRGLEVGIHYDPLLAKVIAHGADRAEAIRRLGYALRSLSIQGLTTNRDFLVRLLAHAEFRQGRAHTGFISEHLHELTGEGDIEISAASAVAAALYLQKRWQTEDALMKDLPPAYRNNPYRNPSVRLLIGMHEVEVSWRHLTGESFEVTAFDRTSQARVLAFAQGRIRLELDGVQRLFHFTEVKDRLLIHSSFGDCTITRLPRHPERQSAAEAGSHNSPMPGQVVKILVEAGQRVAAGDALLILEAMKMEQTMRAAVDGVVESILVSAGQVVGPGEALVNIAAAPENSQR